MSSASLVSSPSQTERRFHARRRMEGLAYVDLGPDNGAILIDLGEGGLGFHSVAPVTLDQAVLLKFKLPGTTGFIESYAEVAWLDESGKCGGLRFAEMSAEFRERIDAWASTVRASEVSATEVKAEVPSGSEAMAPNEIAMENAAAQQEASAAPETLRAPVDESMGDGGNIGEVASADEETADALAAAETSAETGLAAASAPTLPDDSESIAALNSKSTVEKPTVRQSDAATARRPEAAEAVRDAAEPAAGKPIARPAGNAAAKTHPTAGAPPEGVPSRVHSGMVAASASESPARARTAPPAGSATAGGAARSKQAAVSHASNPVSSQSRDVEAPLQPRRPLTAAYGENAQRVASVIRQSPGRQSPERQSQGPAHRSQAWELAAGEEYTPVPEETLASQGLKIGVGAAAGAILVLALVASVPSLRTRILATTSAKSTAAPLQAGIPEFQVEVADINNRRWILRSGGGAESPFGDGPSRRNAQPAAAQSRKGALKSDLPNESDDSSNAPETPQPRTAKPGELALARPLKNQPARSQVQTLPPSIFDGITPPIGSLTDNLPVTGPNAPGPVPAQTQPDARSTSLQAAVLLERVSPVYPAAAVRGGVTGEVHVKATIGKDGVPTNLKVVSGDARLVEAALEAIRQWRYRPATLEGEPIESNTTVSVAFELK